MRGSIAINRRPLLSVTGALEAATGLVLLVAPSVVVELLLGSSPGTPAGVTAVRVAGVAVLALGVACWLARQEEAGRAAKGLVAAMLLYNVGVVVVLVVAWPSLGPVGIGFWPVVLAHAGLAAWCAALLSKRSREEWGENLLHVMARAGDTPDFSTLEARVRETQAEVRRVFLALVGGG